MAKSPAKPSLRRTGLSIQNQLCEGRRNPNAGRERFKRMKIGAVRVATLVFPPAGLVLLWRRSEVSIARKVFGTVGILLFSVIWSALIVLFMIEFCGLEVEFRGGTIPRLTFTK